MNPQRRLFVAALAGMAAASFLHTSQAAPPDFSQLAGRYAGTFRLSSVSTFTADVNLSIAVTAAGRRAAMTISGFGNTAASPQAIAGRQTFTSTRRVTSDGIFLAFFIPLPAAPARLVGTRRDFRFTLRGTTVPDSAIRYNVTLRGRRLTIIGVGITNGSPVDIRIVTTRQGR